MDTSKELDEQNAGQEREDLHDHTDTDLNQGWDTSASHQKERTDLLSGNIERTHQETFRGLIGFGLCCLIIVENVQQHAGEQQNEATRATLHSRESIRGRTREDGEPEMALGHTVIRLLGQHVRELLLLRLASHRQHTVDLLSRG